MRLANDDWPGRSRRRPKLVDKSSRSVPALLPGNLRRAKRDILGKISFAQLLQKTADSPIRGIGEKERNIGRRGNGVSYFWIRLVN